MSLTNDPVCGPSQWQCAPIILYRIFFFFFTEDANLALNKTVWQISIRAKGFARQAVDGNLNANYFDGSCTHTDGAHITPWLTVDLKQQYLIHKVNITNRAGLHGMCFYI